MRTSTAGSPGSCARTGLGDPRTRSSRARSPLARRAVPAGRSPGGTSTGLWAYHLAFIGGTRARSVRNTAWSFVAGSEEATRYSAGIFRVRRRGKVSPAVRARIVRSLRAARGAGAVLRSSGKLGGGWDRVIPFRAKRLKPGFYVCGALDRRGAESDPKGDLRRPGVQRRVEGRLGRAETKALTRTPVRSSMANTCSDESS